MGLRFRRLAVIANLLVSIGSSIAHAQASQPSAAGDAATYRDAVEQGMSEYKAGHIEEALALFVKTHSADPNARTLRGMGMAEYELRRYIASLGHLRQALTSDRKPLTAELRKVQQYVDRVLLDVTPIREIDARPGRQ